MKHLELSTLLEELKTANKTKDILDHNFHKQTEFIEHESKRKALWCTRRAAKSYTGGLYLAETAIKYAGVNCLYLGLTRLSAKGIIWKDILKTINNKYGLDFSFNGTELTASAPNGSIIYVTGIDSNEDDMHKLLGKKWKLVIIDEAQAYTIDLRNLIYGILGPAIIDQGGTICIMGTSGNITQGLFYDITNGTEQGWNLFQWSAFDNPYIARQWKEELDKIDIDRPLFKETPLYKQWYLNQWVVDEEKLVYKFNISRNIFRDLPIPATQRGWTFNLSIDLGWDDDNAFIVSGYHENDSCFYVISVWKKPRMTFDQVTDKIHEFMKDLRYPISSVIIDGANKQGVETMRMNTDIHFEYADKNGKADHIEILNGDLIQAKIKINDSCRDLIDELGGLVWMTEGDKIKIPRKEHPSLPNHLCDAFLYGWRNGYHFLYKEAKKALMPGTPEYIREQEDLHKQAIIERMQRENAQKNGNPHGFVKTKDGRDPWHSWED